MFPPHSGAYEQVSRKKELRRFDHTLFFNPLPTTRCHCCPFQTPLSPVLISFIFRTVSYNDLNTYCSPYPYRAFMCAFYSLLGLHTSCMSRRFSVVTSCVLDAASRSSFLIIFSSPFPDCSLSAWLHLPVSLSLSPLSVSIVSA
uniref:Uncharacterized protein n=1 Tax=Leishmania guyanensis TaxID=5670 RepID=A0A1E1J6N5_LEIGU|nr:Hypothetical protein BN36_3467490 [Leishmania guyanensis]